MNLNDILKEIDLNNKNNNSRAIQILTINLFLISIIPKLLNEKERRKIYLICKNILISLGIPEKEIDKYYKDFETSCKNSFSLYKDKNENS